MSGADPRISVQALPARPHVVVVDNGSTDGTVETVRDRFPDVELVASPDNLGAAGRNVGVARVRTPYVAFCDDDTWWEPGSLSLAADVLDAHLAQCRSASRRYVS